MEHESHEWVTTSAVLRRLADFDDEAAWSAFADRFRVPIERFARARGLGESDAEDVAQETLLEFARSYRDAGYDRGKGRLSSWLFGIAWRRVDRVRRKGERAVAEEPVVEHATAFWADVEADPAATQDWELAWERARLERCLREVRREVQPSTFRVFEMLVLEQRSALDAVAELGLTRNAVYVAKHRVLGRLRDLIAEFDEGP
jgi:RNA polymerase sigma-70 factor (ECF subfamily)